MGDSNNTTTVNPVLSEQEIDEAIEGMSAEEIYFVFAANLLDEKGYKNVDSPEGQRMVAELVPRIEAYVTQELFFALPEKQLQELEGLMNLEAASEDEIRKLYKDAGLDMDQVIIKALDGFKELYLEDDKTEGNVE